MPSRHHSRKPSSRLRRLDERIPQHKLARRRQRANNPLWARAGGQTTGGALPAGRLTRGVGLVVFLLVGGLGIKAWFGQRLSIAGQIERVVRGQYLPLLEKQLGQKVEVGEFGTDWAGRVTVDNIVIGRNASLPTGALIQIKRATLGLDLIGLALGRTQIPGAISSVTISEPQIYLERRADNHFNLQSLFKTSNRPAMQWRGSVIVENGRLFYRDLKRKTSTNIDLQLDVLGLNGTADVDSGKDGTQANLEISQRQLLLVGAPGTASRDFGSSKARGHVCIQPKQAPRGWVDLSLPPVSTSLLFDAAAMEKSATSDAGTIGGQVQLAFANGALAPRGDLQLSGINLKLTNVREPLNGKPNSGAPLQIQNLNGPVRFASTAFESSGLSAQILGAPLQLKGSAAIDLNDTKNPVFDLDLATTQAPLARIKTWLPPRALPFQWQNGLTKISAHLSGTPARLTATGAIDSRELRLQTPQNDAVHLSSLRTNFVARRFLNQPLAVAANFVVQSGQAFSSRLSGKVQANARTWTGELRARDKEVQVALEALAPSVTSAKYGATSAQKISLSASTPDYTQPQWRGAARLDGATTTGINRSALPPQASRLIANSGLLSTQLDFLGLGTPKAGQSGIPPTLSVSGHAALTQVQINENALPPSLPDQVRDEINRLNHDGQTLAARDLETDFALTGKGQHWSVTNARANTIFGPVQADADGSLQKPIGLPLFTVSLADFAVPTSRVNDLLASRGVKVAGDFRGQIGVTNRNTGHIAAQFSLNAPSIALFDLASGATRLSANGARVQGAVTLPNPDSNTGPNSSTPQWNARVFLANATSGSGKLGNLNVVLPAQARGVRGVNLLAVAASAGTNWTARLEAGRVALPLGNLGKNFSGITTISNVQMLARPTAKGLAIAQLGGLWGGSGRIDGTARLEEGHLSAKILAREVDAQAVQRLLVITSTARQLPVQLAGKINAVAQITPDSPPHVQAQIDTAIVKVTLPDHAPEEMPLRDVEVGARWDNGIATIENAAFWSAGTRVVANGAYTQKSNSATGHIHMAGLRLTRALPFLPTDLARDAALDGLASADLNVDWTHSEGVKLSGPLQLRAATGFGVDVAQSSAQLVLAWSPQDPNGWRADLTDWKGDIEDAPFTGTVGVDAAKNQWNVQLSTTALKARRLARLEGRLSDKTRPILEATAPLEGDISAEVNLTGSLRRADGALVPRPEAGFARVNVPEFYWRGRLLGTLQADASIEGQRVAIKTLELHPPADNTPTGSTPPIQTPNIVLTGSVPLDLKKGDVDVQVRVGEAPVSFFLNAVKDARDALDSAQINSPIIERAVTYVENLPTDLRGNVALDGSIGGSLSAPQFKVTSLRLRNGQAPLPLGGFSPPARLDAAFAFSQGVLSVDSAEFRIQKTAADREDMPGDAAGAAPPPDNGEGDENDDTIFTLEPGAEFSPNGRLFGIASVINANLSQIAPWVPALRDADGSPLLRGDLSEFSLRLEGTVQNPSLTGSIQAENLLFRGTRIQRLRVSRFEIANGLARILPGNLTIREGNFQSSAASGSVTWDWGKGPVLDGPMQVDFPLQTRDFGALAGIFVPQLASVNADELNGLVQVRGTPREPQFSGQLEVKQGRFRLVSTKSPLAVGLKNLNGKLSFENGNRLIIDPENPLRGELVDPKEIERDEGKSLTGNVADSTAPAAKATPAPTEKGTSKKKEPKPTPAPPSFQARGQWTLRGDITRETAGELETTPRALSHLRYDLSFDMQNGSLTGPGLSGLNDIALAAIWRTGTGDAANSQTVRWMAAARGIAEKKRSKDGGQLYSIGEFRLRRSFATGMDSLLRSMPLPFEGESDFADFAVFKRFKLSSLPDLRPQIFLSNLYLGANDLGYGQADGRLVMDGGQLQQRPPQDAARLQTASLRPEDIAASKTQLDASAPWHPHLFGPRVTDDPNLLGNDKGDNSNLLDNDLLLAQNPDAGPDAGAGPEGDRDLANTEPLRLGGTLTVHDAEAFGAGSGGEGAGLSFLSLPEAPRFDIRLKLGKNVQLSSSVFRARLSGEAVLRGTPRDPQVLGTLETLDGQIRFPNARARVEEGRISLAISHDPESNALRTRLDIDATARGQSGKYAITLRLHGPLSIDSSAVENSQNLKIEVTSTPPLSQDEAFSQLLGISPRDYTRDNGSFNVGEANEAYATAVISFLSAPFFSGFERSVAQALGLTSISFDYRLNEPLAIELTKALGDRVLITYRRSVSSVNGTSNTITSGSRIPFQLRIDYRLKGNLYLGLQTDEQNIHAITLQKTWRFW